MMILKYIDMMIIKDREFKNKLPNIRIRKLVGSLIYTKMPIIFAKK